MDLHVRVLMWSVLALLLSLTCVRCLSMAMSSLSSMYEHKRYLGSHIVYPDEYLNHLGYLDDGHGYWMHTRKERRAAIRSYQHENGLPETGKIDKTTWRLMKTPRCAVPDIGVIWTGTVNSNSRHRSKRATRPHEKQKAVQVGDATQYKWVIPHLRWRPNKLGPTLPYDRQAQIFQESFRRWAEPTNMIISKTYREPEIDINFGRREHGDGRGNAFDGKGMLLAHAFPPGDLDISGDIHFDSDEYWTWGVNNTETRDLMMIAMHEAGHALGLGHSKNRADIMFPMYLDYNPDPQLSRGDVIALQKLYGSRPGYRVPKPVPQVIKRKGFHFDRKLPRYCRTKFNAVVVGPDKEGYIFMKKDVYKINNDGVVPGYPVHVKHEFREAPINPRMVFYVNEKRKYYFFKGDRVWRFSSPNKTLDEGYPMVSLSKFYKKPRAVLTMKDYRGRTMVLFFSKKYMWRWNYMTERGTGRYYRASTFWKGFPELIDAAVEWTDHYIYFFQHNKYFKASKHRKVVLKGYPLFKGSAWLGGACGKDPK